MWEDATHAFVKVVFFLILAALLLVMCHCAPGGLHCFMHVEKATYPWWNGSPKSVRRRLS